MKSAQNRTFVESSIAEDMVFTAIGVSIGTYGLGLWLLPLAGIVSSIQVVSICLAAGLLASGAIFWEHCHKSVTNDPL